MLLFVIRLHQMYTNALVARDARVVMMYLIKIIIIVNELHYKQHSTLGWGAGVGSEVIVA